MWIDEPPFAADLRRRRTDAAIAARIAAGAVKRRHFKPSKHEPNPPFDLVGGALSAEATFALDLAAIADLRGMWQACEAASQAREAAWCLGALRRWGDLHDAHFRALAAELFTLRERIAKADEVEAAGGWAPEKVPAVLDALAKMHVRAAYIVEELEWMRPDLLPEELVAPQADAPATDRGPVFAHLVKVGGWVGVRERFGPAVATELHDALLRWGAAAEGDRPGIQEQYKATWSQAVAAEKARATA